MREKIRKLYEAGLGIEETAKKLNISKSFTSDEFNFLAETDSYDIRKDNKFLKLHEDLIDLYESGCCVHEISQILNKSIRSIHVTICHLRRRCGVCMEYRTSRGKGFS